MILDPMLRRGVEGGGRGANVGNAQWDNVKNIAKYHFVYHTNICKYYFGNVQWSKVKILAAKYHFVYHTTHICKYYFGNAHWGKVKKLAATGQISFPISYKYFHGPFANIKF